MNLNLSTRTTACATFAGRKYPINAPVIYSLSSNYSIAGATSIIAITGENFREFSMVEFGDVEINPFFINSSLITIYVPRDLEPGSYCVFVYNDNLYSNSIDYTLDESGGLWDLLDNQDIKPNNSGSINMDGKSVLGKYFYSRNIPAAYLIYQGTSFPIHKSILDLKNFYNTQPQNDEISVSIGLLNKLDLSNLQLDEIEIQLSPGNKIVVFSKGINSDTKLYEVLNATNQSENNISLKASSYGQIDNKIHKIEIFKIK